MMLKANKTFPLLLGTAIALVIIGLTMVFSASSIQAIQTSGSFYTIFLRQFIFLIIGVSAALIAFKIPTSHLRKLSLPILLTACLFNLLTFSPLGYSVNGNTNWIKFGPITLQPSEFSKVALIIWIADKLSRNQKATIEKIKTVIYGALPILGFIILGKDLGTAIIVAAIVMGMLFVAGINGKFLTISSLFIAAGAGFLILTQSHRLKRFSALLDPFSQANYHGAGWQSAHGIMALATGGIFGVGLGGSRQKWGNLGPEAHTDFIFAVIGEELGLLGTTLVVALFLIFLWKGLSVAIKTRDGLSRLIVSGVTIWIAVQAMINMGSAIGVFPVVGVPLPLVSYGGSSLISTLVAVALMLRVVDKSSR